MRVGRERVCGARKWMRERSEGARERESQVSGAKESKGSGTREWGERERVELVGRKSRANGARVQRE